MWWGMTGQGGVWWGRVGYDGVSAWLYAGTSERPSAAAWRLASVGVMGSSRGILWASVLALPVHTRSVRPSGITQQVSFLKNVTRMNAHLFFEKGTPLAMLWSLCLCALSNATSTTHAPHDTHAPLAPKPHALEADSLENERRALERRALQLTHPLERAHHARRALWGWADRQRPPPSVLFTTILFAPISVCAHFFCGAHFYPPANHTRCHIPICSQRVRRILLLPKLGLHLELDLRTLRLVGQ